MFEELQIERNAVKENKQGHVIDKSPKSKEVMKRKWEPYLQNTC